MPLNVLCILSTFFLEFHTGNAQERHRILNEYKFEIAKLHQENEALAVNLKK